MLPSLKKAFFAVSTNVLIPLVHDSRPVFLRKLLGPGQVAQFDTVLDIEDRFTFALAHVDVNGAVFVAVEGEAEAILLENLRYR